jgi:hypothetical protein
MLFVIACSCLMMPALTCLTGQRAGKVEQPASSRQQRQTSGARSNSKATPNANRSNGVTAKVRDRIQLKE